MFRIFYAESDATLYESSPTRNTGIDEILEVGKRLATDGETLQKSRSVLKFDMDEVNAALSKYSVDVKDCKLSLHYDSFASNSHSAPHGKLTS